MEVRGVRIPRSKTVTVKSPQYSDSLVIIQWSCDPPPQDGVEDVLLETRIQMDDIGKQNADKFFKYMPQKTQKLGKYTRELNKDFKTLREGSKTAQKFFEKSKTTGKSRQTGIDEPSTTVMGLRPRFNTNDFTNALFNGNIIFLPIHGGHILDEEGDTVKQVVLPEKTYLISFNPPNTNMLFLDSSLMEQFLNIITNKNKMESMLHNSKIRGRVFERELIENLRIWGPGNMVINRGLQLDRDVDILFKPYNNEPRFEPKFKITRGLSKAVLRRETNKTIYDLYPKIIQQMKLARESTTGRGTRKKIQPNQLIKRFKKLKKTLSSNKKFKTTLKQKHLIY